MRIKATPIAGKDLKPGDLFSTAGPDYWDAMDLRTAVGERVYIRTNQDAALANDQQNIVYLIEIVGRRKRVRFADHGEFWFLENDDGGGPLAPLWHCDEDGNVAELGESFAHVGEDGMIRRYQQVIGKKSDLVEVK